MDSLSIHTNAAAVISLRLFNETIVFRYDNVTLEYIPERLILTHHFWFIKNLKIEWINFYHNRMVLYMHIIMLKNIQKWILLYRSSLI